MPKLTDDKKSLGEIAKLPAEEGAVILEPYAKANLEAFKGVLDAVQATNRFAETIRSAINFPVLDFVKNIQLPDVSALMDLRRDPLEGIDISGLMERDKTVVVQKTEWEIEKEEKEAYLTDLNIKIAEAQLNMYKGMLAPQYDINSGIISFLGKKIQIPLNTHSEMICRVVLKNDVNMKKSWSWDRIVELNHERVEDFDYRKIYVAARLINSKVAQITQITDMLLTKPTSTVQLNPRFLAK